jgi:glycosyltransferase involved in cell wall biosynthesis
MNDNKIFVSVVIPTFNRCNYLIRILNILRSNFLNFKHFEVLICDSLSKDKTKIKLNSFIKNNSFFSISYFNVRENNNSLKRNIGIKKAKGKYIILLDDDCLPTNDFIREYYFILEKYKCNSNIYCGSVKYPGHLLKYNFVRYRQSRHFFTKKKYFIFDKKLLPKNIVTMNMAFNKRLLLKNNLLFNEKFNRYGFEDYEFGFRLVSKGFKLIPSSPLVFHYDSRNFQKYLNKLKFMGFESSNFLKKINYKAAICNNFYNLENSFIFKKLIKINFFNSLLLIFEKISIKLEKNFIYFPMIYKFAILGAYLQGCIRKSNKNYFQTTKDTWYK